MEGVEVNFFDGQRMAVFSVEFPSAFGLSNMNPIGCFVASSPEAVFFHKGFQQDGPISVPVFPVIG